MYLNLKFSVIFILLCLIIGCGKKYDPKLYLTDETARKKVKVEQTNFIKNAVLGNPYADIKYLPGNNNSITILSVSTRGYRQKKQLENLLSFDENFRCHIYLQNPSPLGKNEIPLKRNSFIHLMGRYDWTPEEKIFLPETGSFTIDSVNNTFLFGSLNGKFINSAQLPFEFSGQFKVKISD